MDQSPVQFLVRCEHKFGLPDCVKTAQLNQLQPSDTDDDDAFADMRNREFPIHTKAATWLSAARCREVWDRCEIIHKDVVDRIKHAAAVYNISAEVDHVLNYTPDPAELEKAALAELPDSAFCVVKDVPALGVPGGSHRVRNFPVHTKDAAWQALCWLRRPGGSAGHKLAVAQRLIQDWPGLILEKEAETAVYKAAGLSLTNLDEYRRFLNKLAQAANGKVAGVVKGIQELRGINPNLLPPEEKVALAEGLTTLRELFAAEGNPEDIIHKVAATPANLTQQVIEFSTNKEAYTKQQFGQIPYAACKKHLGSKVASALVDRTTANLDPEKVGEYLKEASGETVLAFQNMCADLGIRPIMSATSHRYVFDPEELRAKQ